MPRIRTIKPELWQDEKLACLDPLTRLVFVGLISMADDAGRLVDNVKSIDGFIFPETNDTCKEALDILAKLSRVSRYVAPNGQKVIQIVNWDRHQKVDHPNKYVLPSPEPEPVAAQAVAVQTRVPRETVARSSRDPLATTSTSTPTSTSTNDHINGTALVTTNGRPKNLEVVKERLAEVLASVGAEGRMRLEAAEMRKVQAQLVFAYWAAKMDHPKALLDSQREQRIIKRLEENKGDVHELLYVVDGARKDDWTMGRDPRNTKRFDGIETIFQDRAHVEKFANLCPAHKRGEPHPMAVKYLETGMEVIHG